MFFIDDTFTARTQGIISEGLDEALEAAAAEDNFDLVLVQMEKEGLFEGEYMDDLAKSELVLGYYEEFEHRKSWQNYRMLEARDNDPYIDIQYLLHNI